MRKILIILLTILIPTTCFAAWSDVNIWLANGMTKYRQAGEDGTSGSNTLAIKCAKNEFEPFQVMIYNAHATDAITGVDVTVTEGTGTITDIYIYKELYINASTASRHDYGIGYYPDPLLPKVDRYYGETRSTFPFDIPAQKVQGVWVDIGTTSTTPAGTYTFNVSVTKSGQTTKTATVTLTVWNFSLPSTPTLPSFLPVFVDDLSQGHYAADQGQTWNNTMRKIYYKSLMYHRLGPQTNHADLWFTAIDGSGNVTSESWTAFDAYFADMMDGTIITSGPLANGKVAALTIELGHNITSLRDPSQAVWIRYLNDYWTHFNTTHSWSPRTRLYAYVLDEPTSDTWSYRTGTYTGYQVDLMKCADMNSVTTGGDAWKNCFVTSRRRTELSSPGSPYTSLDTTGIYMPVTGYYTYRMPWCDSSCMTARSTYPNYPNFTNRDHMGYLSNDHSHDDSCSIQGGIGCVDNAPDLMIETPPVLTRGYFWIQWFYRVHGFLYYKTTAFYDGAAPYNSVWSVYHGNGDGILFYPGVPDKTGRTGLPASTPAIGGTHDIPIESIRLKLMRKGIEDREYMELLMASSNVTAVDNQVNTVFGTIINDDTHDGPYYTIKAASDLETARESIANLILSGGTPYPPSNVRFIGGTTPSVMK